MSFDLKNVKATCQKLVTRIFQLILGKMVEVYIDDILIKNHSWTDHL